MDSSQLINWT